MKRYKHDCKSCHFLGRFAEFDLYVCPQHGAPTVIARYGNKGWEYKSGLSFAVLDDAIRYAAVQAFAQGYLVIDGTAKLDARPEV